jgi:hypothetical protein
VLELVIAEPAAAAGLDRNDLALGLSVSGIDQAELSALDAVLAALTGASGALQLGEAFRGSPHEQFIRQAEAGAMRRDGGEARPESRGGDLRLCSQRKFAIVRNATQRPRRELALSSDIVSGPFNADAVAGRSEVLLDSGVRCGQDILKAVALGADAVLIGRSFLYGLGAQGRAGVTLALEILAKELQVSLALTGCNDVREATPAILC